MRTAYACWRCRRGTRRGNLGWEDWMTPGAAEGDVTCPKCNEELGNPYLTVAQVRKVRDKLESLEKRR